jgi:SAM-dependent methyltransferase
LPGRDDATKLPRAVERMVEPELMEDEEQARAYARADFEAPNEAFIAELALAVPDLGAITRAVDLGAGPADIPIRLARRFPAMHLDCVDGSAAMLRFARVDAERAGVASRLGCVRATLPGTPLEASSYPLVLSNSLLHHLHDPRVLFSEVRRLAAPGAHVLISDLRRPESPARAEELVLAYAEGEPDILRHDFLASLRAAFTVGEIVAQLAEARLALDVREIGDRHVVISGRL